ncbi:MAG: IclR family transcriptional regulator [Phycisphaerae bacterium]|nr:IclR family transcriptional regulator [Phycisphaerae bacterium]
MRNATLEKGLLVLETMSVEAREFSLAELAELTGLAKSHACRLLKSLVRQGYVVRSSASRGYQIGLRTLELSASILERMELRRMGLTYLHELTERTKSPSYLGLLHLGKVLTVQTVYPAGVYSEDSPGFGSTMELHDSAMGRVLLAHMKPEHRPKNLPDTEDFAMDLEDAEQTGVAVIHKVRRDQPEVVGVAAAVRNSRGEVIAALGASILQADWDRRYQPQFKNAVLQAAKGLSFAMGYSANRMVVEGLA